MRLYLDRDTRERRDGSEAPEGSRALHVGGDAAAVGEERAAQRLAGDILERVADVLAADVTQRRPRIDRANDQRGRAIPDDHARVRSAGLFHFLLQGVLVEGRPSCFRTLVPELWEMRERRKQFHW